MSAILSTKIAVGHMCSVTMHMQVLINIYRLTRTVLI